MHSGGGEGGRGSAACAHRGIFPERISLFGEPHLATSRKCQLILEFIPATFPRRRRRGRQGEEEEEERRMVECSLLWENVKRLPEYR